MAYVRTIQHGQKVSSSRSVKSSPTYLRMAEIIRIDYEEMTADVIWLDGIGTAYKLAISSAYAGYRSFLGAMPNVGDWVICGFAQKFGSIEGAVIIQFLSKGYIQGIRNDLVAPSKEYEAVGEKSKRYKMQKLYEGEIYGSSTYGSEIYFDKNVTISNSVLNEISMRASDQTISFNSLNNSVNAAGIKINSGIIYRNALVNHPDFKDSSGISKFPLFYGIDGLPYYAPVYADLIDTTFPYGKQTINNGRQAFTEHKIEVKEFVDPILPVTRENSGVDVDSFYENRADGKTDTPLVTQVLGTLVGNDPVSTDGKQVYGAILKPRIFSDNKEETKGSPSEDKCQIANGKDEATTLASAYALKFKSGTSFYVNKEGKYLSHVEASSNLDPIGSGESAELNYKGHIKMRVGKNTLNQRSMTMYTDGGIRTNIGYDNEKGRSWDATFRKSVYWNIQANDYDKVALNMNILGDVRTKIEGSRITEIKGNDVRLVHGTLEDRVFGKKIDNFINDKATNYGGDFNETVVGGSYHTIGTGRKVTIYGPKVTKGEIVSDKTDILLGSSELSLKLGNRKESILAGNHTTTILAGKKEVKITAGNYTVKVTAGNISIDTTLGSIKVGTKVGNVTITGNLGITLKSAAKVKIDAPFVQIGKLPQGGVVNDGACGFPCLFSGAKHIGSKSVTVNTI